MNCNHRTVWNESTQSWTAVSELAKGRTKGNGKVKKNVVATFLIRRSLVNIVVLMQHMNLVI